MTSRCLPFETLPEQGSKALFYVFKFHISLRDNPVEMMGLQASWLQLVPWHVQVSSQASTLWWPECLPQWCRT